MDANFNLKFMKNYIDKSLFYEELVKSFEQDKLTSQAWNDICTIIELISNKLFFKTYEQQISCVEFAKEDVKNHWKGFNLNHPSKPNSAFNYFVEISKRGLAKGWNKSEKPLMGWEEFDKKITPQTI
jgi:hypothetical protein